jgi:hypothetical protein
MLFPPQQAHWLMTGEALGGAALGEALEAAEAAALWAVVGVGIGLSEAPALWAVVGVAIGTVDGGGVAMGTAEAAALWAVVGVALGALWSVCELEMHLAVHWEWNSGCH